MILLNSATPEKCVLKFFFCYMQTKVFVLEKHKFLYREEGRIKIAEITSRHLWLKSSFVHKNGQQKLNFQPLFEEILIGFLEAKLVNLYKNQKVLLFT